MCAYFSLKLKIFVILSLVCSLNSFTAFATSLPGTFNCEIKLPARTSIFLIACGDGKLALTNIKWKTWTTSRAAGLGFFVWNDCEPDCATGKAHFAKAKIVLSTPKRLKGSWYLTRIEWKLVNSKIYGMTPPMTGGSWDLYKEFKEMEGKI